MSISKNTGLAAFQQSEVNKKDLLSRSINVLFPPAPLMPAKGDGTTDDQPAIMAIQQYAINNGISSLFFPKPTARYATMDTLTIDIGKIKWIGERTKIKYIGSNDVPIVKMTTSGNGNPYQQRGDILAGFEIYGTGKTKNTGIHFEGPDANNSIAHIKVDANVHDVKTGVKFFSNTYLVEFSGDAWNCGTCALIPSGGSNYGENIKLTGAYYNSDLAFQVDIAGGEFFAKGASVDYNSKIAVMNNGGKVFLDTSHVEFTLNTNTQIELNGEGATFSMKQGTFVGGGIAKSDYIVYCNAGNNGGAFFDNVYMGTLLTNTDRFANIVKGVVEIQSPIFNNVPNMPRITSDKHNKLIDGSFEKTSIVDEIFISSDTATIANPLTGTNINLAIDATQFRTGAKSLKVTKVGASGAAKFCIAIPTSQYKKLNFKLCYKKPNAETGTIYITPAFAKIIYDSNGVAKIKNTQYQGSGTTVTFTSSAVDWTIVQSDSVTVTAPAWASHYLVEVNMDSFTAGSIFFDDVFMGEI